MPTPEDLLQIESLKTLAGSLRGFGKNVAEGKIGAVGIEQQNAARAQQQSQFEQSQQQTLDMMREKFKFQAEQNKKDRKAAMDRAGVKVPPEINIAIDNWEASKGNNALNSGVVDEKGISKDPKKHSTAASLDMVDIANTSEETWNSQEYTNMINSTNAKAIVALQKAKADKEIIEFHKAQLKKKGESKEAYFKRVAGAQKKLISSALAKFLKTTPESVSPGGTYRGVPMRPSTQSEQDKFSKTERSQKFLEQLKEDYNLIDVDNLLGLLGETTTLEDTTEKK